MPEGGRSQRHGGVDDVTAASKGAPAEIHPHADPIRLGRQGAKQWPTRPSKIATARSPTNGPILLYGTAEHTLLHFYTSYEICLTHMFEKKTLSKQSPQTRYSVCTSELLYQWRNGRRSDRCARRFGAQLLMFTHRSQALSTLLGMPMYSERYICAYFGARTRVCSVLRAC